MRILLLKPKIRENTMDSMQPPHKFALGAIHLWRPHGDGKGQALVDAWGRGSRSAPCSMWTSTQKTRANRHHPVFFSCKEVGIF